MKKPKYCIKCLGRKKCELVAIDAAEILYCPDFAKTPKPKKKKASKSRV